MVVSRSLIIACGVLCLCLSAIGQSEFAAGAGIDTESSWKLPRAWRVRAGVGLEWRPIFESSTDRPAPTDLRNLDLNLGVERRWFERWKFGTGLRARLRYPLAENDDPGGPAARELRVWWYATRTGDIRYLRTQQRFRLEQRFRGRREEPLALSHRLRYQFSFERPLQGLELDAGEWFFVGSAELLLSGTKLSDLDPFGSARDGSVDLRPYLGVGRGGLEIGLEYRREIDLDEAQNIEQAILLMLQFQL